MQRNPAYLQSVGNGVAALKATGQAGPTPARSELHQRCIDDWRVVKRARFNAAERHERKEKATTTAFAVAGIFGFVIPYVLLSFDGSIPKHTSRVIEVAAYLAGALSLVLGLIERGTDHYDRARRFHQCGLDVNRLVRALETANIRDDAQLRPYLEAYDGALRACGLNHAGIDDEMARAGDLSSDVKILGVRIRRGTWIRCKLGWQIYGAYISVCVLPVAVMLGLLLFLPEAITAGR